MKEKFQKALMSVIAIMMIYGTLVLSFTNDANAQTSGGGESPGSGQQCYIRTTSNCPAVGTANGGQRVTCDYSGTMVAQSTCTPVHCGTGSVRPLVCPNVEGGGTNPAP